MKYTAITNQGFQTNIRRRFNKRRNLVQAGLSMRLSDHKGSFHHFNFNRRVQIVCDTENTLADVKARIESTVQYLNTMSAKDFTGSETKPNLFFGSN